MVVLLPGSFTSAIFAASAALIKYSEILLQNHNTSKPMDSFTNGPVMKLFWGCLRPESLPIIVMVYSELASSMFFFFLYICSHLQVYQLVME